MARCENYRTIVERSDDPGRRKKTGDLVSYCMLGRACLGEAAGVSTLMTHDRQAVSGSPKEVEEKRKDSQESGRVICAIFREQAGEK